MARPSYWLRSAASFVNDLEADSHAVLLGIFAPGETLTRIRFSYFLSSYETENPILHDDAVICLGIDISDSDTLPTNFFPFTSPAEPWVWWEGDTQGIVVYGVAPGGGIVTESRGPQWREPRDAKAQRRNDTDAYQSIWLKTQSSKGPLQGRHYLGYAASVLILEAP